MKPAESDRRFLERFPQEQRSDVSNKFLDVIRRGHADPDAVVVLVRGNCLERLTASYRWGDDEYQGKTDRMLVALTRHADEARALARYYIAYEALPVEERQRLKQRRSLEGFAAVAEQKPMTERQAEYIRVLGGDPGSVTSMKQASELIDRLKGSK